MKQIYLLLVGLCLIIDLQAQVAKTIHLTAGTLSSVFTAEEDSTITSLTITGTIDVSDIKTLRDGFPSLTELDLSGASIVAGQLNSITSPANWWWGPSVARANATFGAFTKPSLTSIRLPSTIEVIGYRGFEGCTGLKAINIPSTVKTIGESAFQDCTGLTSITLPDSVYIYERAFSDCNGLTEIPANMTRIEQFIFPGCKGFINLNIPDGVKSIGLQSFIGCTSITTLKFPKSLEQIDANAFAHCPNINSIYSYKPTPPRMSSAFDTKVYADATLYVPFGSKALYVANNGSIDGWNQFAHIVEMDKLSPSTDSLTFAMGGQTSKVQVTIEGPWTATSDQAWLSISPASGNTGDTLSVTVEANNTSAFRFAHISVTGTNGASQVINVTQKSYPVVIPVTAGNLENMLTSEEKDTITSLTLTGTINAYDIKSLNDGYPLLTKLDLSGTTISEVQFYGIVSKANWWPGPTTTKNPSAIGGLTKLSLTSIKLPSTLEVIGYNGLYGCSGLTEITIPSTVTSIGESAFQECSSLASIIFLPSAVGIGPWAFSGCNALTELNLPSNQTRIGRSVYVNCTGFINLTIPEGIEHIGFEAFRGCSNITTLTLPASMESLDDMAFAFCEHITTIYSYNSVPPKLHGAFDRSLYSTGILYVPAGSKEAYAKADEWKDFTHIVEMGGFELSATELSVEAVPTVQSVKITTLGAWSAMSDKDWLTISPVSGDSTQTVTFTSQENKSPEPRTAIVTFTDGKGTPQTVTVTQKGSINSIPVANAGADQSVEEGTLVQLDGSASTDADSDPLIYQWTAPEGITLSSTSDAKPTFTAPSVSKDTTYTFELVVNDGKENSASDRVLISVTNKIIELGISIDSVVFESKESTARILITGNARWTALSDQEWLTVSPLSGEGPKEITLSANANKANTERVAIVTISAPEVNSKTITITQHGLVTGVDIMTGATAINCYPNPFSQEMTIEIANPSHKEVSIEIFSMNGQKIKTLLNAQKGAKISLGWNGEDEQGKQVPKGMYLLKVNGEVRKVMRE